MIELGVKNLVKYYGAHKLFQNVTFDLKTNERIGLIGRNGTGKTTLMKILMGTETYQGEIYKRKEAIIGYLAQLPVFKDETTVMDVLMSAFDKIKEIKERMIEIEIKLEKSGTSSEDLDRLMKAYGKLQQEFERLGGYDIEQKISKITEGINIPENMKAKLFNQLSGGQKSKILLGKILLEQPDILLLDEPSNHLDLASIEWLEAYLKEYKGAVIIISHDRYFLDRVITKLIELDEDGVETYYGNYSYYLVEKERRFLEAMKHYKAQQKKIKRMEEQIKRFRIWGTMRDSEKMFKRAKELEKRLSKMSRNEKPVLEKPKIKMSTSSERSGNEVIILEGISHSYPNLELLLNVDLKLYFQDCAGILGANGAGKTTLLKIIMNEIQPDNGTVKLGSRVKIGYLPQEIVFDNEEVSILELFSKTYSINIGEARKALAKVLFVGDDSFKKIKVLSGGEKSRLKLCMLLYEKVNVLILDEPTNHLDIDSREILEETLLDYKGTIVFVSHDRYFINKIASKIIEIEDKNLIIYKGDYEYFKNEKSKTINSSVIKKKEPKMSKKNLKKSSKEKPKKLQSYYYQVEACEKEIDVLENEIKNLKNEMLTHTTDAHRLHELSNQVNLNQSKLEKALAIWEALQKEMDANKS